MNKILFPISTLALAAVLLAGCGSDEKKLLEPKVYFEEKEYRLEVADQTELTYDLRARLSSIAGSSADVAYSVADSSAVAAYNKKNGTNYEAFKASDALLEKSTTVIPEGALYAESVRLRLSNLGGIEEGKSYLLPICICSASLPVIQGTDIAYFILNKPVRITKAWTLNSNYIKIPVLPSTEFKSVTYEALINLDWFGSNNTIMGTEGILILRIGDEGGGLARNLIQIAGNKQYHSTQGFDSKKWYHVAFTYDQPTGKTAIYINGNKASESTWDTASFDLSKGGCFVGKVAGFMWGERPFHGLMSEVRLWNTSRTENQIKQNMLGVDPQTEGLVAYYKLNGQDQYEKDGKWYIKDASGHNMDGLANGGNRKLLFGDLPEPISIK